MDMADALDPSLKATSSSNEQRHLVVLSQSERASFVQSFGLYGLHGYRSVELNSDFAATIVIAQNGSGKTTLLGALDAFLRTHFSRLRELNFTELRCKLRMLDREMVLYRRDIVNFYENAAGDSDVELLARRISIEPSLLVKFLLEDYELLSSDYRASSEDRIFMSLLESMEYKRENVRKRCDRVRSSILSQAGHIAELFKMLRHALSDIDIVYLPTYRRIELAMASEPTTDRHSRRQKAKFKVEGGSLFPGDIQFGLADLSDRLAELNQRMLIDSGLGYRRISANILNELLDGTFDTTIDPSGDKPEPEELSLFFSRIKEGRDIGPFYDVSLPDFDKLYSGAGVSGTSKKFLDYYMGKLGAVISTTKDIEINVEDFIKNCNKYLSLKDPSTTPPQGNTPVDEDLIKADAKVLLLNRKNLSVHAQSVFTGRPVPLNTLSSGEKQMVSLFARLYLYPGKKIILIDEPELSLSIEWQKQILIDVIKADSCQQMIAITHSPFVFDNELEPYARSLKLGLDIVAAKAQSSNESDFND